MHDPTGEIYGGLVVLGYSGNKYKNGDKFVHILCNCGAIKEKNYSSIKSGHAKSCGCMQGGRSHCQSLTPLYKVWGAMKARCAEPKASSYPDYGGRGISVCDSWRFFENFQADMAETYRKGLLLDRADNERGYCKENCRWVTRAQSNRNTRRNVNVEIEGSVYCLEDAVTKFGVVSRNTVKYRLSRSWPLWQALTTERHKKCQL